MTTQSSETAVRTSTIVEAPIERAFSVFTEGIGSWWPETHHILEGELAEMVFEPRVDGNIYDRKYRHTFESRVFDCQRPAAGGSLRSKAEVAEGATLTFDIRSAATRKELAKQKWRALQEGNFVLGAADRCLQYRAVFRSTNGDRYPILDRVEIELRRD